MEKYRILPSKDRGPSRASYSRIGEVLDIPNLIEVQKSSYQWFLKEGIKEVFQDISPITDYNNNLVLDLIDLSLDDKPKHTIEECKERDATYAVSLRVKCRLHNKEIDEIKEQDIFMGDFPLMTENGTFVINGAERVIVSQLMRSPGIYYDIDYDKVGKQLVSASIIPNRGAWLEFESDSNDVFYVRIDRTRKVPVTVLIRSLGVGTDEEIIAKFGEDPKILATIEKDIAKSYEEGLQEAYKRLRPGEPPTVEGAETLLRNMFFDPKRYDLAKVGRYKFNKKLALKSRITGRVLAAHAIAPSTGEIIAEAGTVLTAELADMIQDAGCPHVDIEHDEERTIRALSNMAVNIDQYLEPYGLTAAEFNIKERVYYPAIESLLQAQDKDELARQIRLNIHRLVPKTVQFEDMMAAISYGLNADNGIGSKDDIDHLGNRRIRAVGELLQNQFRIGLTRMERVVKERMTIQDMDIVTPQALINIRPVTAAIKEFFGSSQLSQFMGQVNPLDELSHKRRLSALGPGGLSRERAGFEVRDVHSSHYGRMCPIETPEGPNIGLINSLATYARINEYGFIEAPYRIVDTTGSEPIVTNKFRYVTADEEENYIIAQANEPLTEDGRFVNRRVAGRFRDEIQEFDRGRIDMMDVSPKQIVSVATALIPFLENDDVSRALMGSNMQRQAVPLITTESPVVGTGMEYKTAIDSGVMLQTNVSGKVEEVTASNVAIRDAATGAKRNFRLTKFMRSNQGTCINHRPIVVKGQEVEAGDVIADGPSTDKGELALGKNPLIGFMAWDGYNYEDAILLSESLVQDDVYTSIHIEEYEAEARDTKLGPEEITRDIPNVGEDAMRDLDEMGIIRIGAEVGPNDILVGKVTPKGETELTAEERLLRAIFGEKAREVRDTSLRVPHGESGIVVDVKVFARDSRDLSPGAKKDELPPGVNQLVRVYIAQKRKISVGDKMAGRHGNKGVVAKVLPVEDMPFLPNGRPLDIVLNPLGVPSRMNIGQVLEVHLGLAAKVLGWKAATPVFDGANEIDIMDTLDLANDFANMDWDDFTDKWQPILDPELFTSLENNLDDREEWNGMPITRDGKIRVRDGRSGEYFDNPITVGFMHYLKLHHLVDDKIHARSTGPYSLVTQQPLGGKAQFGGQRFGEMEVWALEAYGASYTLQEILTVKSDDIVGRVKTYEAIVKGENIPEPGVPESFKVLLKELQALCLDMKVLSEDDEEVEIKESVEEGEDLNVNIEGAESEGDHGYVRRASDIANEPSPATDGDLGDMLGTDIMKNLAAMVKGDLGSTDLPDDLDEDPDDDVILAEDADDDLDPTDEELIKEEELLDDDLSLDDLAVVPDDNLELTDKDYGIFPDDDE